MRRYENRSTIMTSNRPLEEWGKLLGDLPPLAPSWIVFCTTHRPSPLPGGVIGSKTTRPLPARKTKTKRPNPSPTDLRPQNRRAEWLAFRFCSFYFAANACGKSDCIYEFVINGVHRSCETSILRQMAALLESCHSAGRFCFLCRPVLRLC